MPIEHGSRRQDPVSQEIGCGVCKVAHIHLEHTSGSLRRVGLLDDTVNTYSMNLTPRQQEILSFIAEFRREHRCSPSIPEMQRAFGIKSPNGIACHLAALEAKGAIRRADRGSRQVELTADSPLASIPICGAIPAGPPQNFGHSVLCF